MALIIAPLQDHTCPSEECNEYAFSAGVIEVCVCVCVCVCVRARVCDRVIYLQVSMNEGLSYITSSVHITTTECVSTLCQNHFCL